MDELKWRGVTRGFPVLFIVRLQLLPRNSQRFASDCCELRVQPQHMSLYIVHVHVRTWNWNNTGQVYWFLLYVGCQQNSHIRCGTRDLRTIHMSFGSDPDFIEIHVPHAAAARPMWLRQETWSGTPDTGQILKRNIWYVEFLLHKFGSFTTFNWNTALIYHGHFLRTAAGEPSDYHDGLAVPHRIPAGRSVDRP